MTRPDPVTNDTTATDDSRSAQEGERVRGWRGKSVEAQEADASTTSTSKPDLRATDVAIISLSETFSRVGAAGSGETSAGCTVSREDDSGAVSAFSTSGGAISGMDGGRETRPRSTEGVDER